MITDKYYEDVVQKTKVYINRCIGIDVTLQNNSKQEVIINAKKVFVLVVNKFFNIVEEKKVKDITTFLHYRRSNGWVQIHNVNNNAKISKNLIEQAEYIYERVKIELMLSTKSGTIKEALLNKIQTLEAELKIAYELLGKV